MGIYEVKIGTVNPIRIHASSIEEATELVKWNLETSIYGSNEITWEAVNGVTELFGHKASSFRTTSPGKICRKI